MQDIIIQEFIPEGRNNRPAFSMSPEYVTIHDTGNPSAYADAEAHAAFLETDTAAKAPVSWHFTVDGGSIHKEPQIYQHLPLDESGWHAGDGGSGQGNRNSIGIEICMNADGDREKAEKLTAELVCWLYNTIDSLKPFPESMKQHYHWNGKNCPRVIRARENGWQEFLALIEHTKEKEMEDMAKQVSKYFKDVTEKHNWGGNAVENLDWLHEQGLVNGVSEDEFAPDRPLTRFEAAQLMYRTIKYIEG